MHRINRKKVWVRQKSRASMTAAVAEALESRRLLAGGSWTQLQKLTPNDAGAGDAFGVDLSVSGQKLLVGAFRDDQALADSGSGYIIDLPTGSIDRKLQASDPGTGDVFGSSVALSGQTALIGSFLDDVAGTDSGSAYLFDSSTGTQTRKIVPNDGQAFDGFSLRAVSIGTNHLLVGNYSDDDRGADSGSAYVFDRTTGDFLRKLVPADLSSFDRFGFGTAVDGDVALIGAYHDGGVRTGSAYLYDLASGTQIRKFVPPDGQANDFFGISVALNQQYAVIGSFRDDDQGTDSGSVYVFNRDGTFLTKLTASDGAPNDRFGVEVAVTNDFVFVGASEDDGAAGSVYVFRVGTWEQTAKLTAFDRAAGDQFGQSISTEGDYLVIGSPYDDAAFVDSGSAYVFVPGTIAWDGGGDGVNWTDPLNWNTDILPSPTDDVYIGIAANPTIQITGTQTVNSLVSHENLTIAGTLSLAAASTLHATTTLVGTNLSGVLIGAGDVTVTGSLIWTTDGSGSFSVLAGSGDLIIAPGASASIIGNVQRSAGKTIRNAGTTTWLDGDVIGLNRLEISTLINEGTFTVQSNGFADIFGGPSSVITNTGTLSFTGTGRSILYPRVDNAGTINAEMPLVETFGPVASSGTLHVGQGSSLRFSSTTSFSNPGLNIGGAGWAIFRNNSHSLNAANTITASVQLETAQLILNAPQMLPAFNLGASSSLTGSGDVTVTGTLNWTGGTMSGSGKTIIAAGGTATISGGHGKNLNRTLDNFGVINDSSGIGFSIQDSPSALNNMPGAVFNATGNASYVANFHTSPAFNNMGTFNRLGAGTTTISHLAGPGPLKFNNSGTVNVDGGVLELRSGGTHSAGTFAVDAGATLQLGSPGLFGVGHQFAAGTTIAGMGNVVVSGGTNNQFAGTINLGGTLSFTFNPATISGSTSATTINVTSPSPITFSGPVTASTLNLSGSGNPSPKAFNAAVTVGTVNLSGAGNIDGSGDVTVTGTLNWTGGTMSGSGKTIIAAGATASITSSDVNLSRALENAGVVDLSRQLIMQSGTLVNLPSGLVNVSTNNLNGDAFRNFSGSNLVVNAGTLVKTGMVSTTISTVVHSTGTIDVMAGTLSLNGPVNQQVGNTLTGGTWRIGNGSLDIATGSNITTSQAIVELYGSGSFAKLNALGTNVGTLTLSNGRDFSTAGAFTNTGTLNLGAGSVLTVNGNFTQPGSAINVDIAGPNAGTDFGQVVATGAVSLGGALTANLVNGYNPPLAQQFPVVIGASRTGTFTTFTGDPTPAGIPLRDDYTATSALVVVGPPAPALTAATVNDGDVSRSSVRSLTLAFDHPVTLSPGAIAVFDVAGNPVAADITNPGGDSSTYLLTFTGPDLINGSLPDGFYTLSLQSALIVDAFAQPLAGGDTAVQFHRLFGDTNGDTAVGFDDLGILLGQYETAVAPWSASDLDGDGNVTFDDLGLLLGAYDTRLVAPVAITVNDGDASRSSVRSLTLAFDHPVTLSPGAIAVFDVAGNPVAADITNPGGDSSTYLLTFTGPDLINGSLPDGFYTLSLQSALIIDAFAQPLAGGDATVSFHRLFGDINGDTSVGFDDLGILLGQYEAAIAPWSASDLDGDGNVTFDDLGLLLGAYDTQLSPPADLDQPAPADLGHPAPVTPQPSQSAPLQSPADRRRPLQVVGRAVPVIDPAPGFVGPLPDASVVGRLATFDSANSPFSDSPITQDPLDALLA